MTRNSRMPDSLAADLDAECSACLMGSRRLSELFTAPGVMPGTSLVRSRKLRSADGRSRIWSRETFVPISEVRDFSVASVVTTTPASCVAVCCIPNSRVIVCPIDTVTARVWAAKPSRLMLIS